MLVAGLCVPQSTVCVVHVWSSWQNKLILSLRVGRPWLFWFFISRANSQPAPTSEPVRVNSCLDDLSREASHCHHSAFAILILLHPLIDVVSNYTPGLHTHAYDVPELLFLGSLAPICLSLASCQNSVLNWWQRLFHLLIFVPFVKTPNLLKFSIMTQTQLSGFVLGAHP